MGDRPLVFLRGVMVVAPLGAAILTAMVHLMPFPSTGRSGPGGRSSLSGLAAGVSLLMAQPVLAQDTVNGRWTGHISAGGQQIEIAVHFVIDDGVVATIDIPSQQAKDLPLRDVRVARDSVHFALQGGPGLAVFDGVHYPDSIAGRFSQAGINGTFLLRRPNPSGDVPREQARVPETG